MSLVTILNYVSTAFGDVEEKDIPQNIYNRYVEGVSFTEPKDIECDACGHVRHIGAKEIRTPEAEKAYSEIERIAERRWGSV